MVFPTRVRTDERGQINAARKAVQVGVVRRLPADEETEGIAFLGHRDIERLKRPLESVAVRDIADGPVADPQSEYGPEKRHRQSPDGGLSTVPPACPPARD